MAVIAEKELKLVRAKKALARFNAAPSIKQFARVAVRVSKSVPNDVDCIGIPVGTTGEWPRKLGVDRATLRKTGFEGEVGQTMVWPDQDGPTIVVVGIGDPKELDTTRLREAAAALARAARKQSHLATTLADTPKISPDEAAQAVVEGVLLASYSYDVLKGEAPTPTRLDLTLVGSTERQAGFRKGAERGRILSAATMLARDLANAPATHLTASRMVEIAKTIAADRRLSIQVFDIDALERLGCGGLLGVNRGSVEPPYMIRLKYQPRKGKPNGHVALVGKGIMFDSGGISLKPNDMVHSTMKLDMAGAGAILSAMSALPALECPTSVTGYLMCTDNMPSGSAMVLGDVLTIRGGKTIEVLNTDAEGRLILADGLVMAAEEKPDAIVTIATLTGAALRALGPLVAAVLGNNQSLVDQAIASAERCDEPIWQLPLERRYRKQLDSPVADMNNVGGEHAGTITAGLFLEEFVSGIPWAHIDIAGTVRSEIDESWRTKGATGFGARLLADLVQNFTRPGSAARGRERKAA